MAFPSTSPTRFDYSLPAPVVGSAARRVIDGGEIALSRMGIVLSLLEPAPAGLKLSYRLLDASFARVDSGSLAPIDTDLEFGRKSDQARFLILRWKHPAPDRRLGPDSQVIDLDAGALEPLAFTSPPVLVIGAPGLQVGSTVGVSGYTFTGAAAGTEKVEIYTTATASQFPGGPFGTKLNGFVPGSSVFAADQATRHPWAYVSITRGAETVGIWTEVSPTPIAAAAGGNEITLLESQVQVVDVLDRGNGYWQPVFYIDPSVLDASQFTGTGSGLVPQALFTKLTTSELVAIENAQPLTPADYAGLAAPPASTIKAQYTGSGGYWIINETPAQTAANAGKTYEKSYFLKEGRPQDFSDPRRVVKIRVSKNGGVSFGDIPTWFLQPNIPAVTSNLVPVANITELRALIANPGTAQGARLAGGNYGALVLDGANFPTPFRIESASITDPAIFNVSNPISLTDCSNIIFDRVHLIYNNTSPAGSMGFKLLRSKRITLQNFFMEGFRTQISISHCEDITVQNDLRRGCFMDFGRLFFRNKRINIKFENVGDHFLTDIGGEHRDIWQIATNPGQPGDDGLYGCSDVLFEGNHYRNNTVPTVAGTSQYVQMIFFYNDMLRSLGTQYPRPDWGSDRFDVCKHTNIRVINNLIEGDHTNGIAFAGVDGGEISGNVLRGCAINLYRFNNAGGEARNRNLKVQNNVMGAAISAVTEFGTLANPSLIVDAPYTNTGNVVSATAWPSTWPWGAGNPPPVGPTNNSSTPSPPTPTPVGTALWRSPERTPGQRASRPTEYGFGYQFMRCMMTCEDFPQYIIGGGDMNGIRLSATAGKTWFHAISEGLKAFGFNAVYIDPRNPNLLLAIGSMCWHSVHRSPDDFRKNNGIWRSTDLGKTWRLVQQMATGSSGDEFFWSMFTYDPASRANPSNRRRIYMMQQIREQREAATGKQLWVSDDGGATWAKDGPQLAVGTFGGEMHILKAHPVTGRLYMGGSGGVFLGATNRASWTRITGLPAARCVSLDFSPSGTEAYAAFYNGQVYRSGDSGATWTQMPALPAVAKRMAVDWRSSPEIVFVLLNQSEGNGPTLVYNNSGNGTGVWRAPTTITPLTGWPAADRYHTRALGKFTSSVGFECMVTAGAGVCVVNGQSRIWRTENGGPTFVDCSQGFTGLNAAAYTPSPIAVRPDNPNFIAIPLQDTTIGISFDGLRSILPAQMPGKPSDYFSGFSTDPRSTYCVEWLPPAAGAPYGIILAGFGKADQQGLIRGIVQADMTVNWTAIPAVAGSALRFIKKHPTAAAVVAADRISLNGGLTFPVVFSGIAVGLSGNGALYVMRANNTEIWKSTDWHTRAASGLAPTFTQFYQGANFNKLGYPGSQARVSPTEENTIWIEGAGRDLYRIKNAGSTFAAAVALRVSMLGLEGMGEGGFFSFADVCPDPQNPNMVYATGFISGGQAVWRGILNGSSVTWTDISANSPKWQDLAVNVLPTGDVLIGGAVGNWVAEAPAGYRAAYGTPASIWPDLPEPVPQVHSVSV